MNVTRRHHTRWLAVATALGASLIVACGGSASGPPTPPPTVEVAVAATPTVAVAPPTVPPPTATPVPPTATAVPPTPVPTATLTPDQRLASVGDLVARGEFDPAIDILLDLRQARPGQAEIEERLYQVYLAHASALLQRGELDNSYAQYARALELRRDDPAALEGQKQVVLTKHWNRMDAFWSSNIDGAIAEAEEILKLDREFRDGQVTEKLYVLLLRKSDGLTRPAQTETIVRTLLRALEIAPDRVEARQHLARALVRCEGGFVNMRERPVLFNDSSPPANRPSCSFVYVVGRSEGPGRLPDISASRVGQTSASHWYLVRTLSPPTIEGWVTEDFSVSRPSLQELVARLPVAPVRLTSPEVVPDMSFGTPEGSVGVGTPCNPGGPLPTNFWTVKLKNSGRSSGPRAFDLLVRSPGESERRVAIELARGFEPGEEIRIGQIPDHSSVTFDPDGKVRDANRGNNVLRVGGPPAGLVCLPIRR